MPKTSRGFLSRRIHEPDLAVSTIGLLVGLALLPLTLGTSEVLAQFLPIVLILSCGLYQVVRFEDGLNEQVSPLDHLSLPVLEVVAALVFVGVAAMAVTAVGTGGRTIPFYAVAAVTASAIFLQILFGVEEDLRPGLILFELVVFSLVLRFAALLTTPGLIGVDSWTHITEYAAAISAENSLSAIAEAKYYAAPLYHLVVVTVADALRIPLRAALYASIAIVVPVASLLVYAGGRYVLPARWALLAVAIFSVADHVIRWGIHLIPTSLGLVFFAGVVFALARTFVVGHSWRTYVLAIVFSVATILTHQISAFVVLVVLATAAVVTLLARWDLLPYDLEAGLGIPALFAGYTIAVTINWAMTPSSSGSFLETMPEVLSQQIFATAEFLNLVSGPPAEGGTEFTSTTTPLFVALADSIGLVLFIFVAVIGTLALLRYGTADLITLIVVAAFVVTGTFTLILPLFGINAFIPGRWYAFMYVPMALVAAFGLWYVAQFVPRKVALGTLVVFAAMFPAGMMIANKATIDGPVAEQQYPQYAYSESELAAVETIGATLPETRAPLVTDHPYRTVFVRTGAFDAEPLELRGPAPETYLYRTYQTTGAPTALVEGTAVTATIGAAQYCGSDRDRVYSNGDVMLCTAS